jgi:signal transduction histidine kinase
MAVTTRPEAVRRQDKSTFVPAMTDSVTIRDQPERRIEGVPPTCKRGDKPRNAGRVRRKLATIGQLASSVGHELRNPLGVMSNAAYIIERSMATAPTKAQEYLKVLNAQIRLSERIVTDLLDSARNSSPQRRRVDVETLLTEQLERVTVPSNVRVDMAIDPGLPRVNVDPDQVGQILVNLFTNATQAMDEQPGVLSVAARNGDWRVRIQVCDTGPGVPEELGDKIFEPLFTTKARGIGLGLSVSKSLAMANSGSLSVANHPDGGAVFTLDLPVGELP